MDFPDNFTADKLNCTLQISYNEMLEELTRYYRKKVMSVIYPRSRIYYFFNGLDPDDFDFYDHITHYMTETAIDNVIKELEERKFHVTKHESYVIFSAEKFPSEDALIDYFYFKFNINNEIEDIKLPSIKNKK